MVSFGIVLTAAVLLVVVEPRKMHPDLPKRPDQQTGNIFQVPSSRDGEDSTFWYTEAQNTLENVLQRQQNTGQARNVIFFLGDGMSIPTVTAARIYAGQKLGGSGEEYRLPVESFPGLGLAKTYAVDRQVPDSANTATAYLCGSKANYGTIGVDAGVERGDCDASLLPERRVNSILQWAQDVGKLTGVVTTTRITHATPAGTYAHTANRDWERDAPEPCKDIARQLVEELPGRDLRVVFGGGRDYLSNNRPDGQDLTAAWLDDKTTRNATAVYATNRDEFLSIDPNTDFALALLNGDHLSYVVENQTDQPSLEEMTRKAIEILQKAENGFALLVEGGRIDMGHHDSSAIKALEEAVAFFQAIQAAVNVTSADDTLIVVTADHAHTMNFNGYPNRGNNILGFAGETDTVEEGISYTTLMYGNGPGYRADIDLGDVDPTDVSFKQLGTVPLGSETHGGDDVAVFSSGPMSHLLTGVYEQNYIAHAIGYAACMGPNLSHCSQSAKLNPQLFPAFRKG